MKVLHLVAIGGRGGTGASVVNLSLALADAGCRVWVACFPKSHVRARLEKSGRVGVITHLSMSSSANPWKMFGDLFRLVVFVKREKVDVVNSHSSPDSRLAMLLKLVMPQVKFVRTRHVPVPIKSKLQCKVVDGMVAVSFAVKRRLGFACAEKALVVYDAFRGDAKGTGNKGTFIIRNISRYARVKGLVFFAEALNRLKSILSFKADIVGRGNSEDNPVYRSLKKYSEVVQLKGYVEEINDLYGADVVCLTSVGSEGSSRVAIEAVHFGVPVVCHDVGALYEIVRSGKTGFVVVPGDVEALKDKVLFLWRYPVVRRRFAVNASRLRELFSTDRLVEQYLRIYKS